MRGEPTAPEKSELKKIRLYLAQLRSKTLLYREYSTIWNLQVLGEEYVKRMRRDLPPLVFKTSILCERLDYAVDGFYPAFTDKVRYSAPNTAYLDSLGYNFDRLTHVDCRMDGDVDLSRQLLIAFDFNANINWMIVGQMDDKGTLRILKSFPAERGLPQLHHLLPGGQGMVRQRCLHRPYHGASRQDAAHQPDAPGKSQCQGDGE